MARLRTFIAVDLAQAQKDRLLALQENLTRAGVDVKWVEEDNLHVTLLFLGEVDVREVVQVCKAVSSCCAGHSGFGLTLSGVSGFPNPRRPRVIYAGIEDGAEELKALHADLEPPLLELGCYRREDRPYTPHVTLGRAGREGGGDKLSLALTKVAAWQGGTTEVREVLVLSSELTSRGPIYTVLSRVRLTGRRTGGSKDEEE